MDLSSIPYLPARFGANAAGLLVDPRPADIVVLHSMEAPAEPGRATNWAKFLASSAGTPYYAHFYTDPRDVVQVAPLGQVVWHCGRGNSVRGRWTCAVECAGYASMGRDEWLASGALDTAKPLVDALIAAGHGARRWLEPADLLVAGARGLTSHDHMRLAFGGTDHTDPGDTFPYDRLLVPPDELPPPPAPEVDNMIASARNADGRLEVFRVDLGGKVQHAWQPAKDGPLGAWADMNCPVPVTHGITAVPSWDGRIELFAYVADFSVFHIWQTVPNGGWSGWVKV